MASKISLLDLPVEVLQNICRQLVDDPEQPYFPSRSLIEGTFREELTRSRLWAALPLFRLCHLTHTCSALRRIFEPYLWERLVLGLTPDRGAFRILNLLIDRPELARYIKYVSVDPEWYHPPPSQLQFYIKEAIRIGCTTPDFERMRDNGGDELMALLGPRERLLDVHGLVLNVLLTKATRLEEIHLYPGWRQALGKGLPANFKLESLRHVRILSDTYNSSSSFLPLLAHAPNVQKLFIYKYHSPTVRDEEKERLWEILPELTAVDLDRTVSISCRDVYNIGKFCQKLESFRYTGGGHWWKSILYLSPHQLLRALHRVRTTLCHLDIDLSCLNLDIRDLESSAHDWHAELDQPMFLWSADEQLAVSAADIDWNLINGFNEDSYDEDDDDGNENGDDRIDDNNGGGGTDTNDGDNIDDDDDDDDDNDDDDDDDDGDDGNDESDDEDSMYNFNHHFEGMKDYTTLRKLRLDFNNNRADDNAFLANCLPPNLEQLQLIRAPDLQVLVILAARIRLGNYPSLKKIWYTWSPAVKSEATLQRDSEALDTPEDVADAFEGTGVRVREMKDEAKDSPNWHEDYIPRRPREGYEEP